MSLLHANSVTSFTRGQARRRAKHIDRRLVASRNTSIMTIRRSSHKMSLSHEVRAIRCRKKAIGSGLGKDQEIVLTRAARERALWEGSSRRKGSRRRGPSWCKPIAYRMDDQHTGWTCMGLVRVSSLDVRPTAPCTWMPCGWKSRESS